MFRKACDCVRGFCSTACSKVVSMLMLGVVAFTSLTDSVLAQTANEVEIATTDINWQGIPAQIMSALTAPIVVGIGIALSIWVVFAALSFFRRSARS